MLRHNSTMQKLNLSANALGQATANSLGNLLATNKALLQVGEAVQVQV